MTVQELLRIEPAQPTDAALTVALVRELAVLDDVRITPDDLRRDLFGPRAVAEAVVAYVGHQPAGFEPGRAGA